MLKIGLTGNIASGKTTVKKIFEEKGVKVLCLDEVTEFLYQNEKIKSLLVSNFQTSNKKEIAKIVFSDNKKLVILNKIFHPEIKNVIQKFFMENINEKLVVVDGALIFEAGFEGLFDKIITVISDEKILIERIITRNNLPESEAKERLGAQMPQEIKAKKSDYPIYNNSTKENLKFEVEKIIKEIIKESKLP